MHRRDAPEVLVVSSFRDVILAVPGLTHYYPLNEDAKDVVGGVDGIVRGNVKFDGTWARFDGASSVELPDRDEFSAAGTAKKELTILVFQTVDDWTKKSANGEYVHWMGKGKAGAHEWVFRYYIDGGGGEAPARKRRTSFYNFNPSGGLGTGSYFQDTGDGNGTERVIVGMVWGNAGNNGKTQMWKDGRLRDTDLLSEYDVYPQNTSTPVFLGSRGDNTGFLVGRLRRVAFFDRKLTETEIRSLYDARDLPEGSDNGTTEPPAPTPDITEVFIGDASYPVNAVNERREANQLVVYTDAYGTSTGANEWGAEAAVANGSVVRVDDGIGNMAIPEDGFVVSAHGMARAWLTSNAAVGLPAGFEPNTPEPEPGPDLSGVNAAHDVASEVLTDLERQVTAAGAATVVAAETLAALQAQMMAAVDAVTASMEKLTLLRQAMTVLDEELDQLG